MTPSCKKAGGQHGHTKSQRPLVERPDTIHDCKPTACRHCGQPLHGDDPRPLRHQVWDIPPIRPVVTEYRRHRLRCPCCGITTCGQAPAGQNGARLKAACALLTGAYRLSKAKAARLLTDLLAIPLCAGQVCATEAEVGQGLRPVVDKLLVAARQQPANVDETSMGHRRWLWVMVTAVATVYQIVSGRNRAALRALVGTDFRRVLTSDRHSLYSHLAEERHQWCWSHLKRDFQAMVDRHNAGSPIGEDLLLLTDVLFGWWHRVRDGTLSRRTFRRYVGSLREDVLAVLEQGCACGCAKTVATCRELLAVEEALWTFVRVQGVEPTNNHIERMLRLAVLWRKKSFGSQSESACRFVERLLTVVQTRRLQGRPVLDYLYEALVAHRAALPAPQLLPTN
jgi:transposase